MFGNDAKVEALIRENAILKLKHDEVKAENKDLKSENDRLTSTTRKQEDELKELRFQQNHLKETTDLDHDKKVMALQRDMQKSLVQSDLTRVEALAKLEIYEKTDSKADANHIKEMIGKLIDQLGKQQAPASINVVI